MQSKIFSPSLVCLSSLQNRKGTAHLSQRLLTLLHQVTCMKLDSGGNIGKLQRNWKTPQSAPGLDEAHWETAIRTPSKVSMRRNIQQLPLGELPWLAGRWAPSRCWDPRAGGRRVKAAQVSVGTSRAAAWAPAPLLGSSSFLPTAVLSSVDQTQPRRRPKKERSPTNTSSWAGQGTRASQGRSQHPHLTTGCGDNWLRLAPALRRIR